MRTNSATRTARRPATTNGAMLVLEERPPLEVPAAVFGLQGFLDWIHSEQFPQGCRASFLAGEVNIDMSAEELLTHNFIKRDVGTDLTVLNRRHKWGQVFVDRALLVNEAVGLSSEPDLMLCLSQTIRSGRVRLAEVVEGSERYVEVRGSPDLVVEIMSDSSVRKDTIVLPELYYLAGVKEYWIIDARGAQLDFRLLIRGRGRFRPVEPDPQGYWRSLVLGRSFRLTKKKAREAVDSECRLLSRE